MLYVGTFGAIRKCAFFDSLSHGALTRFNINSHTRTHTHRAEHSFHCLGRLDCRAQSFIWQLCTCSLASTSISIFHATRSYGFAYATSGIYEMNFLKFSLVRSQRQIGFSIFGKSDVAMLLPVYVPFAEIEFPADSVKWHENKKGVEFGVLPCDTMTKENGRENENIFSAKWKVFQDAAINGSNSGTSIASAYS